MGFFGNSSALEKIDRDIAAIADGSADLSYSVGHAGSDAAGRISGNINRFFSRVRGLISHARERSVSIAADAARMNHLVQQTDDAVRRQESLAANVFESSNLVNQAVSEVARNSDAIQASTQNNLDLAQRSLEQMETVASTMRSTNAHIEHFSATVAELHTNSMKIDQIVSDQRHFRPDQSAGAQCRHRGSPGRRGWPRVCRGRRRSAKTGGKGQDGNPGHRPEHAIDDQPRLRHLGQDTDHRRRSDAGQWLHRNIGGRPDDHGFRLQADY
jgi:hypothetical protein